jgi:hypothetical protein
VFADHFVINRMPRRSAQIGYRQLCSCAHAFRTPPRFVLSVSRYPGERQRLGKFGSFLPLTRLSGRAQNPMLLLAR